MIAVEGAAMAYMHIKHLIKALRKCGKSNLGCQTKFLLNNKDWDVNLLGFTGYDKNREASFTLKLRTYNF